ncbi:MAG: transcriptional regulator [Tomitella sp.]|nr:transcriptional regulator [Tomitella sp.]
METSGTTTDSTGQHQHGYLAHAHKENYLKRLRRIEGQARGLQSVALRLLGDHMAHCVVDAAQAGGPEAEVKLKEASEAIARLVRS